MEKQELFQIGEVAKMFQISVGTLRHYEKMGLVKPEYIDQQSNYRYYSIRQLECLNTIRYLRALDMPLDQIKDFLNNRDIDKIQTILQQQKEKIISKQKELKIIEKKIDNRLAQLKDALASQLDVIRIIEAPACRMAWISHHISIHSYLDLETSIRQLQLNQKSPMAFLGKVGVSIEQEALCQKQFQYYQRVFLLLDEEEDYNGTVETLPPQTCVSIRFCGGHQQAITYYIQLIEYIEKNHLRIAGSSREITMIDDGMTNQTDQFVTEIQIPISNKN